MLMIPILLGAAVAAEAVVASESEQGRILQEERDLVRAIVEPLSALGVSVDAAGEVTVAASQSRPGGELCDVNRYADRVSLQTFEEIWPDGQGGEKGVAINGEMWTEAIQATLDEHSGAYVPDREEPYYIDRPIILRSGNRLRLGGAAELRMKPGCNFCMVRNEHLISGEGGAVAIGDDADRDIVVQGGIWTTLATSTRQWNGNLRARADATDTFRSHGVLLFSNVRNLQVRDLTVRQCKPHALQISNCSHFLVDGIRFEEQRRDGVHINGPVSYGVIRDIRNAKGRMGDDMIALNAWDWKNTSMTFGPIHHVLIEDVQGSSTDAGAADTRAEIRLLGGTKRFDSGAALACDIEHCVIRRVAGIRTFKMYDQPNLELGRDNDFADPIGSLNTLYFDQVAIEQPTGAPVFQIGMNGKSLAIHDVRLGFDPAPPNGDAFALIAVGPRSQTYRINPNDPGTWVEIFSPDKDCTVSGLRVFDVLAADANGDVANPVAPATLVEVVEQTVNPDYPNTTPRGGTGKGILRD
jgi:hypothetical protein